METKVNNGGEQQPIDEEGRYTFKSFQSPKKSGLTKMNFMGKTIYNHKNGYIDETGHIVLSIPNNMTLINMQAHYFIYN